MQRRRPGRPRSLAAHASILEAAIALVREVGYDAVTMDGIAARSGVGKATVYRRWPGKETLVAEAIGQLLEPALRVPDTGTTRGDVRALLRVVEGMYGDPATPLLLSGLVAAMARSRRIAHAVRSGFVAHLQDALRAVLGRGVSRRELRPSADLELALDLIAGAPFHRALIGGRSIDGKFLRAVADVVLRGLAPPGSLRRRPGTAPRSRQSRRQVR